MLHHFSKSWCLVFIALVATSALAESEWKPLFNGENLDGWTPKVLGYEAGDDPLETFRVEDGMIQVSYENYEGPFAGRFGHLFFDEPFSNYKLRVEYRFVGEQAEGGPGWALRNSGLMLHGQDPATMRKNQEFPVSIEVQLLGGDGENDRTTANMCSPGTHIEMDGRLKRSHCINSESETYHGEQWVTCEVEVRGNESIKHYINGALVMEYEKPQLDDRDGDGKELIENDDPMLSAGTISLQSESHPVHFRKVEIMELKE